ncbi:hypothetical protein KY285_034331 [Solanum tuberosum]|nr:hypothetical protein KY289_034559 [Solanum tuberosum]KAH0646402.1 hypothetical protein KY284_034286 [Solanum tuberosum]KAH0649083.1 hypothetical protein KY285_034331 [Solanum tuberosum]
MREKNDVEKLSLVWSESSTVDNSQTERDTKELPVTGYRGTKFSNWLADPLFLKLVTDEFYGSSSSKKPFNSLEKLEFAKMPEWKQWHVLGSVGEMSYCNMILKELRLEERDISPELLPRACELTVGGCPNLTRSMIPTAPERISIWRCENLEKNSVACGGPR